MQGGYGGDYSLLFIFSLIGLLAVLGLIIAAPIISWIFLGKAVGITVLIFYGIIGLIFWGAWE